MNFVHLHSRLVSASLAGRRTCLVAIAIGLMLTGAPAAFAQTIFANLSGTVTDATGAVVAGAKISIQNVETQVVRQLVTNNAGFFSATELPTGTYKMCIRDRIRTGWAHSTPRKTRSAPHLSRSAARCGG